MSKVITLRLSDEEYNRISAVAKIEHRPISNLITALALKEIEEAYFVDPIEMAWINLESAKLSSLKSN